MRIYVKTGLAGYGPDLEPEDEPFENLADLCYAIRDELDRSVDSLVEMAQYHASQEDFELAYHSRALADELTILMANLDYDKRLQAPLYAGDASKLDETVRRIIVETFPLDIDAERNTRLYVWEATD